MIVEEEAGPAVLATDKRCEIIVSGKWVLASLDAEFGEPLELRDEAVSREYVLVDVVRET